MSNQVIPEAAVEAAAKRLATIGGQPHNWTNYKAPARAALEAAAPHMGTAEYDRGWEDGSDYTTNDLRGVG